MRHRRRKRKGELIHQEDGIGMGKRPDSATYDGSLDTSNSKHDISGGPKKMLFRKKKETLYVVNAI